MTEPKKDLTGLDRLKQAMVDDLLSATDAEILADFAEDHGPPEVNAAEMRALFEQAVIAANKRRLHAARAGAAAVRRSNETQTAIPLSAARETLRRALANHAGDPTFTLAARKEGELSDADVLDMLEVMRDLGLLK